MFDFCVFLDYIVVLYVLWVRSASFSNAISWIFSPVVRFNDSCPAISIKLYIREQPSNLMYKQILRCYITDSAVLWLSVLRYI